MVVLTFSFAVPRYKTENKHVKEKVLLTRRVLSSPPTVDRMRVMRAVGSWNCSVM